MAAKAKKKTAKTAPKKTAAAKPAKKAAAAAARTPVDRARYPWKEAAEKAAAGTLPKQPDFSAPTHARFMPILDQIKEALKSDNPVPALKKIEIDPVSSTPIAMNKYRDLCVTALQAKAKTVA